MATTKEPKQDPERFVAMLVHLAWHDRVTSYARKHHLDDEAWQETRPGGDGR